MTSETNEQHRSTAAWLMAVIVGIILAIPTGWLFSYIGSLVAMLGLFFFLFLGHLIGAFMYRVGRRVRPIALPSIIIGTSIVAIICWGTGLYIELASFPTYTAQIALKKTKKLPDGDTPESYVEKQAEQIAATLEDKYPPGRFLGALKWKLTDNKWDIHLEGQEEPVTIAYSQSPVIWMIRVVASLALLWIALYAQTSPLQRLTDKKTETEHAED